eukprot:COSAG06_NODE_8415_length_2181_cov_8.256964_2_plen_153_part_00
MAECYQHQPCGRHATSETRKFKVAESSAGKHVVCQDRPWIATPWQLSNVISWCGRCGWTSSGRRRRRIRTSWCTAVMQQAAVGAVSCVHGSAASSCTTLFDAAHPLVSARKRLKISQRRSIRTRSISFAKIDSGPTARGKCKLVDVLRWNRP